MLTTLLTTIFKSLNRKDISPKDKRRRIINLSLFFLATLYVGLCPPMFYSRFEFFPHPYDAEKYAVADKLKHEDVFLKASNGKRIHGWFFEAPNAKHTIIVHHGQGQNIAYFFPAAQLFHNVGTNVFMYDYEGFGRSEGPTAHEALRRDSEAAYTYIRDEKHIPPEQIVHCGISLGSGAACDIASRHPCEAVFLCSPYWRLSEVASRFVPALRLYPRIAFPQPDYGSEELVTTKKIPVLVVHGDNDFLIPLSHGQKTYNAARGPKQLFVVHNGFHVGGLAPGIEDFCTKWLDSI